MSEEKKMVMELIGEAKKAKSVEALLELAKEKDIKLEKDRAQELFDSWHGTKELADDELDNVSGGGCGGRKGCPNCGSSNYRYEKNPVGIGESYMARCGDCDHIWPVEYDQQADVIYW